VNQEAGKHVDRLKKGEERGEEEKRRRPVHGEHFFTHCASEWDERKGKQ